MSGDEIEAWQIRFENWRRWCRAAGYHQGHAFSIEGLYRSPQHWYPDPPRPEPLDVNDAVLVNRGYVYLALVAERQAKIIKILTFRAYLRPQWQAQKLGMHWTELGDAYYRAKLMMRNQVFILEKKGYTCPTVKPVTLRVCEA